MGAGGLRGEMMGQGKNGKGGRETGGNCIKTGLNVFYKKKCPAHRRIYVRWGMNMDLEGESRI